MTLLRMSPSSKDTDFLSSRWQNNKEPEVKPARILILDFVASRNAGDKSYPFMNDPASGILLLEPKVVEDREPSPWEVLLPLCL